MASIEASHGSVLDSRSESERQELSPMTASGSGDGGRRPAVDGQEQFLSPDRTTSTTRPTGPPPLPVVTVDRVRDAENAMEESGRNYAKLFSYRLNIRWPAPEVEVTAAGDSNTADEEEDLTKLTLKGVQNAFTEALMKDNSTSDASLLTEQNIQEAVAEAMRKNGLGQDQNTIHERLKEMSQAISGLRAEIEKGIRMNRSGQFDDATEASLPRNTVTDNVEGFGLDSPTKIACLLPMLVLAVDFMVPSKEEREDCLWSSILFAMLAFIGNFGALACCCSPFNKEYHANHVFVVSMIGAAGTFVGSFFSLVLLTRHIKTAIFLLLFSVPYGSFVGLKLALQASVGCRILAKTRFDARELAERCVRGASASMVAGFIFLTLAGLMLARGKGEGN